MAMMQGMREPGHEVREELEVILSERRAIPQQLRISNVLLPIKDLAPAIENFIAQKQRLDDANSEWPAVQLRFDQNPALGIRWIPLDLGRSIDLSQTEKSVGARLELNANREVLLVEAERANFSTRLIDTEEARRSFLDVISYVIGRRVSGPADRNNNGPPSDEFEITTDLPNEEILFSTGFFVSTEQGFGISTPATRRLEWGVYTFGINRGGSRKFSQTAWTVPDVLSVHLTV